MQIIKSNLKKIIQEEISNMLKEAYRYPHRVGPAPTWVDDMENLLTDIWLKERQGKELFANMPEEGKSFLIQNLEMYAERYPEREEFAQYLNILKASEGG